MDERMEEEERRGRGSEAIKTADHPMLELKAEPRLTSETPTQRKLTNPVPGSSSSSLLVSSSSSSTNSNSNSTSTSSSTTTKSSSESSYQLKWIKFKKATVAIVTQNENGPCPIIAIMNVLLLRGKIKLPSMMEVISFEQLMEYLADSMISTIPSNVPESVQLNYEQNMHDALAILPKLQTGLDVNVKFTGITQFEYTPELIVFDLLGIPLYHGWLVEPLTGSSTSSSSDHSLITSIGTLSYNQVVDKVINNKSSSDPDLVAQALELEQFLERTATQLTNRGLSELKSKTKEDKLGVLFRNNHFITLYKHKSELYQLVTDQGFLNETDVVWETLRNIDNDGQFVDSEFVPVPPKSSQPVVINSQQQVDQDYLLALSLQEEAKKESQTDKEWETYKNELGVDGLSDEELARRLQSEEEKRYQKFRQKQQQKQVEIDERVAGHQQQQQQQQQQLHQMDSQRTETKAGSFISNLTRKESGDPPSHSQSNRSGSIVGHAGHATEHPDEDESKSGKGNKPVCLLM